MQTGRWEYDGLKVEGLSLAGVRTCITLPQHSIAFDVAQGLPHAMAMKTFLISHGHMDHAAGIPYVISQKAMNSHSPPRFIMPAEMVEPMKVIMRQWARIEGHEYEVEFIGASPGDSFPLKTNFFIRTFATFHRIPCLGYSLCRKYRKLRPELADKSSDEIIELRRKGEDPTVEHFEVVASFTGDTKIEFLDENPEVRASKVLIMEATYLDERKTVGSAREWGHIHLDELIERLPVITSERILLIHSSARYSVKEAREILNRRLPEKERDRVVLFEAR